LITGLNFALVSVTFWLALFAQRAVVEVEAPVEVVPEGDLVAAAQVDAQRTRRRCGPDGAAVGDLQGALR